VPIGVWERPLPAVEANQVPILHVQNRRIVWKM